MHDGELGNKLSLNEKVEGTSFLRPEVSATVREVAYQFSSFLWARPSYHQPYSHSLDQIMALHVPLDVFPPLPVPSRALARHPLP